MAWDYSCADLRDILAEIYLDVADAKRLARDAQLDLTKIDIKGNALNFWSEIIRVAEQDGQLLELIQRVRNENARNEELSLLQHRFRSRHTRPQLPREPIPRQLLYLPDRYQQEFFILESIQKFNLNRNRPLVYIIHGDEHQSHDMFLKRMKMLILPRLLTFGSQEVVVKGYSIPWLNPYREREQVERWLVQKLSEQIDPADGANVSDINSALALHPGPVMIQTHLMTRDWFKTSPLETFLHFWNAWPSLNSPYPLILCFCIKYQEASHMRWQWLKQRKYKKLNSWIKREVENLDIASYSNLHITTLAQLHDVERGDVEDWARRRDLRPWCALDKLLNEISTLFQGREGIPMNALADDLEQILLRLAHQS